MDDSYIDPATQRELQRKERLFVLTEDADTLRRYRLTPLGYTSDRYGPCEICGCRVSDVHYQVRERLYRFSEALASFAGKYFGWIHEGGAFGHRRCLEAARQGHTHIVVHPGPEDDPQKWEGEIAGSEVTLYYDIGSISVHAAGCLLSHDSSLGAAVAGAVLALGADVA